MRFVAPLNVSAVTLSCGEFAVDKNGFVEVPDDIETGDVNGLFSNGFRAPLESEMETGKSTRKSGKADAVAETSAEAPTDAAA
jgi:hypothetical protein